MLQKILAELVKKYPGLSKQFLGQLAGNLAKTVTAEDQIEGKLTELDNLPISIETLAADFQKEGDRRVSDAKKEWDKKNPKKPENTPEPDDEGSKDVDDKDTPAWAKAMAKQFQSLTDTVTKLSTEKAQSTNRQKAAERLKDVPEIVWTKRVPEKEEDLEAFITEVEADWNKFKQDEKNKDILGMLTPGGGGPNGGADPSAASIKADIDKYTTKTKPQAAATAKTS